MTNSNIHCYACNVVINTEHISLCNELLHNSANCCPQFNIYSLQLHDIFICNTFSILLILHKSSFHHDDKLNTFNKLYEVDQRK
ncbi:hypothetical protein KSF78_0002703 [Schistosoma japonicum]|nr:hypothetical protein KSF78_0002703 [Schistosoma japonicum]